jgi:biotin-(acetyl-CoA carboxylase) ligase
MNSVLHLLDIAFLLELIHREKPLRNVWITQGINMSSKKMRFLNMLRKQRNLTEDAKMYIAKYKIICKRIIREAKRKENRENILHAKHKSKAVWQIINKETGRTSSNKQNITETFITNKCTSLLHISNVKIYS